MLGEQADGVGRQRDAGVHRHVVEQHRHRRLLGDGDVVPHERVAGHHVLEERRRAHQHGVDAKRRGAPAGGNRRLGGFARRCRRGAGASPASPSAPRRSRGRLPRRRAATASPFEPSTTSPVRRRLHVAFDVAADRGIVDRVVAERRDDGRVEAWQRRHTASLAAQAGAGAGIRGRLSRPAFSRSAAGRRGRRSSPDRAAGS